MSPNTPKLSTGLHVSADARTMAAGGLRLAPKSTPAFISSSKCSPSSRPQNTYGPARRASDGATGRNTHGTERDRRHPPALLHDAELRAKAEKAGRQQASRGSYGPFHLE